MQGTEHMGVEALKINGYTPNAASLATMIGGLIAGKGYGAEAIVALGKRRLFGPLVQTLVTQVADGDFGYEPDELVDLNAVLNYLASTVNTLPIKKRSLYRGKHEQNARIDRALATNPAFKRLKFFGQGVATDFYPDTNSFDLPDSLLQTPIAIIGYGASGILTHYALRKFGFRSLSVFDKGRPLGLWDQKNVYQRSRNNPRDIDFFGETLDAAPGDGEEVRDFLDNFAYTTPHKAKVTRVEPGRLNHVVHYEGREEAFPILINAMGLGSPSPLSDPRRMITSARSADAGPRWQQNLTRKMVSGKLIVLIGLGNSTAEMLRQIHDFMDAGIEVDYRVLTHYPEEALLNPDTTVSLDGRSYRLFRNLEAPNLVDYQGDLPDSRRDFLRALGAGKIISGVRRWEVDGQKHIAVYDKNNLPITEFLYDQIYTLTGYHHTESTATTMGCTFDRANSCVLADYDGELIADPKAANARDRLHVGYFGMGPVLEAPHNPNAIVIPGMIFRLPDMLFSIIVRAAEYARLSPNV